MCFSLGPMVLGGIYHFCDKSSKRILVYVTQTSYANHNWLSQSRNMQLIHIDVLGKELYLKNVIARFQHHEGNSVYRKYSTCIPLRSILLRSRCYTLFCEFFFDDHPVRRLLFPESIEKIWHYANWCN